MLDLLPQKERKEKKKRRGSSSVRVGPRQTVTPYSWHLESIQPDVGLIDQSIDGILITRKAN